MMGKWWFFCSCFLSVTRKVTKCDCTIDNAIDRRELSRSSREKTTDAGQLVRMLCRTRGARFFKKIRDGEKKAERES
ncbi:hypothetical protein F5H01DRAFT_342225 [Linnemannia elongata]|nr:hypothetical protein F5H01DRAFT_342225 [Linnemannia elongata]